MVDEYASLKLNPNAVPYAVYGDCPASDTCDYCEEGAEYPAGHSHAMYENREGASHRTADELADVFLDSVEFYAAPWQRPEYCPRNVEGWLDDSDDSEALSDCLALGESALYAVGLACTWNDGYVIERVTPYTVHVSTALLTEYRKQRKESPYFPASSAVGLARWRLTEPALDIGEDGTCTVEREGFTVTVRAPYDYDYNPLEYLGTFTDDAYRTAYRYETLTTGTVSSTRRKVSLGADYARPNERNPRGWYVTEDWRGQPCTERVRGQFAYVQLESGFTREDHYTWARENGMSKAAATDYAAERVGEDIARLTADYYPPTVSVVVDVSLNGVTLAHGAIGGLDLSDSRADNERWISETALDVIGEAIGEARDTLAALVATATGEDQL